MNSSGQFQRKMLTNANKYIEDNFPMVVKQALKFKPTELSSTEDYIQAGLIGLLLAIKSFKPEKNVKLSSYAWRLIYQQIIKEWQKSSKIKTSQFIDYPVCDNSNELVESYPELNNKDREMLFMRAAGNSYQEIASHFGNKSPETIRQKLENIYKRIRESNAEKANPVL